ncbi:MAG: GH32 C-terminal domain-containing protein [Verrucomicrobiales bacterium]
MKRLIRIRSCAALVAAGLVFSCIPIQAHDPEPGPRQEADTRAVLYSLADDFYDEGNNADRVWTYGVDDTSGPFPVLRFLSLAKRDANALWGSEFAKPPLMWSEASGYWGIGRNLSGEEQVSARNGVRWAPGEVLLHPGGSDPASGLVVGWTAPGDLRIDLSYTLGRASPHGNGIGYELVRRTSAGDSRLVALKNVGSQLANELNGMRVTQGDQLLFRFHTDGDPGGDIARVGIVIRGQPGAVSPSTAPTPTAAIVTAGSDLSLTGPATAGDSSPWFKEGQPIPGATGRSLQIVGVQVADAGTYSVVSGAMASVVATVAVVPHVRPPDPFASPVPRQVFPETLAEQEEALKTDPQMQRFAASRKRLSADRYRPAYHFVSPESQLNDPNGLCFWQGRWHLFYQGYPPDEFPDPADLAKRRQHWGHAVSEDLVHWRDLPYAIYPGVEKMCFSGSTVVEPHQVVAYYLGIQAGQMVAIAKDPLLLNWEKPGGRPVNSPSGDSCIWKEGDTYFGLVGATLVSSKNLTDWTSHGDFLEGNPFPLGDASACPNFVPIGDKHLYLSFSHTFGGQYLLGDYNRQSRKFKPYAHGRFNHGRVSPGGVHAPSAAADGKGGVINILNINDGESSKEWDQIMSLAQQLTLGPNAQLRIAPVDAVQSLRGNHQRIGETILPANQEIVLESITGNTMELAVEIDPKMSRWVQLNVLRSPNAEEQTSITFYNFDRKLSVWYDTPGLITLDGTRSSTSPDTWIRPPERADLVRSEGPLKLRVFLDRSVVEVFANDKLYLAIRVYPAREDSLGISLRAQGQEATLQRLDAWSMKSIWP